MIILIIVLLFGAFAWLNHDAEKESHDYKKYF